MTYSQVLPQAKAMAENREAGAIPVRAQRCEGDCVNGRCWQPKVVSGLNH